MNRTTGTQTSGISACSLLLHRSYIEFWRRGEEYARQGKTRLIEHDERRVIAQATGTRVYRIELAFRGGGISKKCSCPYAERNAQKPCKHMIATAILWDEVRGMSRPTADEIEDHAIPPPLVSRSQIVSAFDDPLHADLDVLRLAVEDFALSPRAHARLPNIPRFEPQADIPLSLKEVQNAWREIRSWSRRRTYDRYFCAGEMVAAFCEVMRTIFRRMPSSEIIVGARILRSAQEFHYCLIQECVDDSDGLHAFTEAYLEELYRLLIAQAHNVPSNDQKTFNTLCADFEKNRDQW